MFKSTNVVIKRNCSGLGALCKKASCRLCPEIEDVNTLVACWANNALDAYSSNELSYF